MTFKIMTGEENLTNQENTPIIKSVSIGILLSEDGLTVKDYLIEATDLEFVAGFLNGLINKYKRNYP